MCKGLSFTLVGWKVEEDSVGFLAFSIFKSDTEDTQYQYEREK